MVMQKSVEKVLDEVCVLTRGLEKEVCRILYFFGKEFKLRDVQYISVYRHPHFRVLE